MALLLCSIPSMIQPPEEASGQGGGLQQLALGMGDVREMHEVMIFQRRKISYFEIRFHPICLPAYIFPLLTVLVVVKLFS